MSNPYFKFKKFTVYHDLCAMKVGTDGVLLGAWTSVDDALSALDIGSGSGLISLMLAQRNSNLFVDAIDLDKDAYTQSYKNFSASIFSERLISSHQSLCEKVKECHKKYDLIVSNPPYFKNSLKSNSLKRTTARHTDTLSMEDLFFGVTQLLSIDGILSLIYPYDDLTAILEIGVRYCLYPKRITKVRASSTSSFKRVLIEFSFRLGFVCEQNVLQLEQERHVYSNEFCKLVKDFYLNL